MHAFTSVVCVLCETLLLHMQLTLCVDGADKGDELEVSESLPSPANGGDCW
jgi:hypothetical protein